MRVNGYFVVGRGAFVNVEVRAPLLPHPFAIPFLIDVGASHTILAHQEFLNFGGDFAQLARSPTDALGFGGTLVTYELPSAALVFTTADGRTHVEILPVMLVSNYDALPPDLRSRQMRIPSVLGRDVLDRNRLVYDPPANEVFFTDER